MLSLNCDYIPCVLDRLILAIPLLLLVYVTSCCTAVLLKTIRIMILYFDILRPLTSDVGPLYFFNAVICFIIQEKWRSFTISLQNGQVLVRVSRSCSSCCSRKLHWFPISQLLRLWLYFWWNKLSCCILTKFCLLSNFHEMERSKQSGWSPLWFGYAFCGKAFTCIGESIWRIFWMCKEPPFWDDLAGLICIW